MEDDRFELIWRNKKTRCFATFEPRLVFQKEKEAQKFRFKKDIAQPPFGICWDIVWFVETSVLEENPSYRTMEDLLKSVMKPRAKENENWVYLLKCKKCKQNFKPFAEPVLFGSLVIANKKENLLALKDMAGFETTIIRFVKLDYEKLQNAFAHGHAADKNDLLITISHNNFVLRLGPPHDNEKLKMIMASEPLLWSIDWIQYKVSIVDWEKTIRTQLIVAGFSFEVNELVSEKYL